MRRFESRFEWWQPEPAAVVEDRGAPPAEGGGILYDLGTHLIDQAMQLFGPVADVHAESPAAGPSAAADDDVFLALEHDSGVALAPVDERRRAAVGPRFRVLGSTRRVHHAGDSTARSPR